MNVIALQRGLWVAVLAAQVLLIGKLWQRRLIRRYPFFFLYLAADVIWGTVLIQIDFKTVAYAYGYRFYLITMCVLRLGVVAELYERVCEHFHGIGSFRGYMAAALLGLSALLSFATFFPNLAAQWGFPQTVAGLFERYETSILCLGLILTRFMLHHFLRVRPPIRSNVLRHWALLTAYLGVRAATVAAIFMLGGGRKVVVPLNITTLLCDLICLMAWTLSMTQDGEILPQVYVWSAEGEARREELRQNLLEVVERTVDDFFHRR